MLGSASLTGSDIYFKHDITDYSLCQYSPTEWKKKIRKPKAGPAQVAV